MFLGLQRTGAGRQREAGDMKQTEKAAVGKRKCWPRWYSLVRPKLSESFQTLPSGLYGP
jgi:hypothetical protein